MYSLVLSLVLSSPHVLAERLNVEVDGKECVIKEIIYDDTYQVVLALGNCQIFYDMCTKDFCNVKKFDDPEDVFNIDTDNIGFK